MKKRVDLKRRDLYEEEELTSREEFFYEEKELT